MRFQLDRLLCPLRELRQDDEFYGLLGNFSQFDAGSQVISLLRPMSAGRGPQGTGLGRGQPLGDMHRRGLEAELACGLQPGVPGQHDHRLVHHDGLL